MLTSAHSSWISSKRKRRISKGDLVSDPRGRLGIVVRVKRDVYVVDPECNDWSYPDVATVMFGDYGFEINPTIMYNTVSF
mgnify:CR=1 FL=1